MSNDKPDGPSWDELEQKAMKHLESLMANQANEVSLAAAIEVLNRAQTARANRGRGLPPTSSSSFTVGR